MLAHMILLHCTGVVCIQCSCAAFVGRRHAHFVEVCLSSLLRTHPWLTGKEPSRHDPAYLTVLLVVLNAEPYVPGMRAAFPRHVSVDKLYLRELVPSLVPPERPSIDLLCSLVPADLVASLSSDTLRHISHDLTFAGQVSFH
ncbi:unnamed protein product [Protopolystoma xenopodis]|uniref:Secreted protein n=1 Tax=Protopolystoma xenopodis TaxID=117903 RepID=A0A3S5A8H1_9PLAT|nr:unnamed protein product [Protopolystoma xenopodis]